MRRIGRMLCLLLFMLWQGGESVAAEEEGTLEDLLRRAAATPAVDTYSAVCRFCYADGTHPAVLSAYADSLRQLGVRTRSARCFLEYYAWKSEACFQQADYQKGYALKRSAIALAERMGDRHWLVESASDMAYYFNIDAQYDSARHYLNKGLAAARGVPDLGETYRTMLTNYASSFLFEGQSDSALVYTDRARQASEAAADTAMFIENLNQLGTLYRRQRKLEECLAHFEQALRLCEAQDNFQTAAYIYGNLSTVYAEWKQPDMAVVMSRKALDYARRLGNEHVIGTCMTNLGIVLCRMPGHEQEGIQQLLQAVELLEKINNRRRLCEAYSFLANIYVQVGEAEKAAVYLDKMEHLASEMQTDVEFYRYYRVKGVVLQSQGHYAEATACYKKLTDMLRNGYRDTQDFKLYADLSDCYIALHRPADALQALQTAYALRDSMFRHENTSQLSYFSVKYDMKEMELKISRLEQARAEEHAQALERRIFFGAVISLLLIVLILLLYARQRQRTRMARLAQAVGQKEQQFLTLQKETEQRLTRRYIEGLESERTRIATELHDDVCNSLLALSMDVRSSHAVTSGTFDRQLKMLEDTRQRLRSISHELMPPVFQYATLHEMLDDYVHHLQLPDTLSVSYTATDGVDWSQLPQPLSFEYYRIVQEAVGNAVKYASASLIRVNLTWKEGVVTIEIADDGCGFDASRRSKGIGLRTITQRVQAIGGHLILDTAPGAGTVIRVSARLHNTEK